MGFFSSVELDRATPPGCGHSCTLYRQCQSPKMQITGLGRRGILIVTEVPEKEQDETGRQQVGVATQCIRAELALHGVSLENDCWKINAVCCFPKDTKGEGRTPTPAEIQACRPNILRAIASKKPKLILIFGRVAMESIIGYSNPDIALGKNRGFPLLRGKRFPDRSFPGSWLAVTFPPSYILSSRSDPVIKVLWKLDIKRALEQMELESAVIGSAVEDEACCKLLTTPQAAIPVLEKLLASKSIMAEDYETTGLKPHAKGHHVVSVGFAVSTKIAFSFPLFPHLRIWDGVNDLWAKIMETSDIGKIGHNIPFEFEWTRVGFDTVSMGWIADTQVLAHLEDSRRGHSGLKVQAYLKFGVSDYVDVEGANVIDRYKRADSVQEKLLGCNARNRMDKAPLRDLLRYNALDALYTFRLWHWYYLQGLTAPDGKDFIHYG